MVCAKPLLHTVANVAMVVACGLITFALRCLDLSIFLLVLADKIRLYAIFFPHLIYQTLDIR
jgi:hypothetical protein